MSNFCARAWGARHEERGSSAVEFALVVPVLLLIAFGLIQYGLYFWAMQGGSDLARSAARLSAVGDPARCTDFRSRVSGEISHFQGARGVPTVQRTYSKGPGNTGTGVEVGDVVTVTISFKSIDLGMPLIPFLDGGVVTQSAEARVEYAPTQPEPCP